MPRFTIRNLIDATVIVACGCTLGVLAGYDQITTLAGGGLSSAIGLAAYVKGLMERLP